MYELDNVVICPGCNKKQYQCYMNYAEDRSSINNRIVNGYYLCNDCWHIKYNGKYFHRHIPLTLEQVKDVRR